MGKSGKGAKKENENLICIKGILEEELKKIRKENEELKEENMSREEISKLRKETNSFNQLLEAYVKENQCLKSKPCISCDANDLFY